MNKWFICGSAFWAVQMLALAQTDMPDVPPPSPPFVQFPQPNMAFAITVTTADGQPVKSPSPPPASSDPSAQPVPPNKQLVKVDAVQIGAVRRDTYTWNDNSQSQTWFVGKFGLIDNPKNDNVGLIDPVRYPPQRLLVLRRDASDYFAWLSSNNYVGVVGYHGTPCYQFKIGLDESAKNPGGLDAIMGASEKIAWIDVKTKLPVAVQIQGFLYTYAFRDLPTDPLVMPPKFKAKVDRYQLLNYQ